MRFTIQAVLFSLALGSLMSCWEDDSRQPSLTIEGYSLADLDRAQPTRVAIAVTRTNCAAPNPSAVGPSIVVRPAPNETCTLGVTAAGFQPASVSVDVPASDDPVFKLAGPRLARVVWLTPQ